MRWELQNNFVSTGLWDNDDNAFHAFLAKCSFIVLSIGCCEDDVLRYDSCRRQKKSMTERHLAEDLWIAA